MEASKPTMVRQGVCPSSAFFEFPSIHVHVCMLFFYARVPYVSVSITCRTEGNMKERERESLYFWREQKDGGGR
jgi:hypothetical protein